MRWGELRLLWEELLFAIIIYNKIIAKMDKTFLQGHPVLPSFAATKEQRYGTCAATVELPSRGAPHMRPWRPLRGRGRCGAARALFRHSFSPKRHHFPDDVRENATERHVSPTRAPRVKKFYPVVAQARKARRFYSRQWL